MGQSNGSTRQKLLPIGEDIWVADGAEVRMDLGPLRGIPFATRMTVIRLANGELLCHSPIEWSEELAGELQHIGVVGHLVSPNFLHYVHIPDWKRIYPAARSWASPGIERQLEKRGVPFTFDEHLQGEPPMAWAGEVDQFIFPGSAFLKEVVFFHHQSRTLILTDLVQNHERRRLSMVGRIAAWMGGALEPDGTTPLDIRLSFIGNKRSLRDGVRRMQAWHPKQIVISHGRWFPCNGERVLERLFRWTRWIPF